MLVNIKVKTGKVLLQRYSIKCVESEYITFKVPVRSESIYLTHTHTYMHAHMLGMCIGETGTERGKGGSEKSPLGHVHAAVPYPPLLRFWTCIHTCLL